MSAPFLAISVGSTPVYFVKAPINSYESFDVNMPDHVVVIVQPISTQGPISIHAKSIIVLADLTSCSEIELTAKKIVISLKDVLHSSIKKMPPFMGWFRADISVELAQVMSGVEAKNGEKIWLPIHHLVKQVLVLDSDQEVEEELGIERPPLLAD